MNRVRSFCARLQIRPVLGDVEIQQSEEVLLELKPEVPGRITADDVRESRVGESGMDQNHHACVVRHPGFVARTDRRGRFSGVIPDEFLGGLDGAVDVAKEIVSSEYGGHQRLPDGEVGRVQSYGHETGDGGIENVGRLGEGGGRRRSGHCRSGAGSLWRPQ